MLLKNFKPKLNFSYSILQNKVLSNGSFVLLCKNPFTGFSFGNIGFCFVEWNFHLEMINVIVMIWLSFVQIGFTFEDTSKSNDLVCNEYLKLLQLLEGHCAFVVILRELKNQNLETQKQTVNFLVKTVTSNYLSISRICLN